MKTIYAEGHRGMCAMYPENTLISFEAAIDFGVDAIEFDVWLSKDKIPVIIHDGDTMRTTSKKGHVRDMNLSEIKKLEVAYTDKFGDKFVGSGAQIPTLEELLRLVKSKKPSLKLGVEIKEYTEENVDLTVELLKKYGFFDSSWFYAFNARIIKYIKTKYNGRTMGYPDFFMQEFMPDSYSYYDEIGLSMSIVKSEIFDFYRAKNFPMHLYCADTEEDVKLCIEKGADLITANDPTALLNILKAK